MFDELLKLAGIESYDSLNPEEKRTFSEWVSKIETNTLTVDDARRYVSQLRAAVAEELATHDLSKEKDLYCKAKLKCYITLEMFLLAPEREKNAIYQQIKRAAQTMGKRS